MDNKHFIKWIPHSDVVAVYDMEDIGWRNEGFVLTLFPDDLDPAKRSKYNFEMVWQEVLCYQVTDERYRPDLWVSSPDEAWTFYTSESSEFLENFRKDNDLVPDTVYHFIVGGTNFVIDILSTEYPKVRFANRA
ncbi:hypothetical protein LIR37_15240 [Flavonifractor plautii]|jgi:hypothetical protein|uniref:hypothetical protein n=1 Tax=Flavonifractor plautii TaxID=292800 RepID=UPI001D002150|nr:hypothetical protein [Flavonifractor plautii]MCB5855715.1 hypothetical protein [Flavonifractor plautii]